MFERRPVAVPNHGIGLDPPAFGAKPQKRSLCTLFAPLFNPYCVCVYACANQYLNKKLGSRWYIYIYIYIYILHNISISVLAQAPEICFGGIED